jgi:hypothetical protein
MAFMGRGLGCLAIDPMTSERAGLGRLELRSGQDSGLAQIGETDQLLGQTNLAALIRMRRDGSCRRLTRRGPRPCPPSVVEGLALRLADSAFTHGLLSAIRIIYLRPVPTPGPATAWAPLRLPG